MSGRYKYIHVFWHSDLKFSPRIVEMIYNLGNGFAPEDHLFVTPHENVYAEILNLECVNKERVLLVDNSQNFVNQLGNMGDWIILHSLNVKKTFFINKKCRKKIVWRTWGHDVGFNLYDVTGFRLLRRKFLNYFFGMLVSDFKAIGIAKVVDIHNIHRTLGIDKPFYVLGYSTPSDELPEEGKNIFTENCYRYDGKLNILVGHSGSPLNNHIYFLNILRRFSDKIHVFLILSYGIEEYIKKVRCFVESNCNENVTIIDKFMPLNEYMSFLDAMDIAIFDAKGSYALGNIAPLVSKKKKLFFNEDGILHYTFLSEGIPHCCTNEIAKMTFEEFAKPLEISDKVVENLLPKPYEYHVKMWHKLFDDLDKAASQWHGGKQKLDKDSAEKWKLND